MANVSYGKCNLWQMYYGKCNYGKCNYGKSINETEPYKTIKVLFTTLPLKPLTFIDDQSKD